MQKKLPIFFYNLQWVWTLYNVRTETNCDTTFFLFDLHCVSLTCFYNFITILFIFLSGLDFQKKMDVEMDEPEPVTQNNEKVK